MLVKAKWNVKGSDGVWHMAGEVFNTDENLGNAVEALEAAKKPEPEKPVKAEHASKAEPVVKEEPTQPKSTTTRRKTSK